MVLVSAACVAAEDEDGSGASGSGTDDDAIVTSLSEDVSIGATVLFVDDIDGIEDGDTVTITDGANTETTTVSGDPTSTRRQRRATPGSFTIANALANAYTKAAASITVTPKPGKLGKVVSSSKSSKSKKGKKGKKDSSSSSSRSSSSSSERDGAGFTASEFDRTSTRVVSTMLSCLQMQQFSNTTAASFDASAALEYKDSLAMDRLRRFALAPATAPCTGGSAGADSPHSTASTVAAAARLHFQEMISAQPPLPDTAPLSERLVSIKTVLNICLQAELLIAPTTCTIDGATDFDCNAYMLMHVDPAISLIKDELEVLKGQVRADPDKYRQQMADLSTLAGIIYDEAFGETFTGGEGGDLDAYNAMLQGCETMPRDRAYVEVSSQPTKDLIPLVLLVRSLIPEFEAVVKATVADVACCMGIDSGTPPTIVFRRETKPPFRVIEKSLTKGPNQAYPDCSKVLDMFGCIIDCADYASMTALLAAFVDKHNAGELDLSALVDRWTAPAMGWRDVTLNLVIESVTFEVQISHSKMFVARAALDAHQVHNQFRSFAEVFPLLGLSPEVEKQDEGGMNGGSAREQQRLQLLVLREEDSRDGSADVGEVGEVGAVPHEEEKEKDDDEGGGSKPSTVDSYADTSFVTWSCATMARVSQLVAENKRLEGELEHIEQRLEGELEHERAARVASEALVIDLQKEVERLRSTCRRLFTP